MCNVVHRYIEPPSLTTIYLLLSQQTYETTFILLPLPVSRDGAQRWSRWRGGRASFAFLAELVIEGAVTVACPSDPGPCSFASWGERLRVCPDIVIRWIPLSTSESGLRCVAVVLELHRSLEIEFVP